VLETLEEQVRAR